MSSRPLFRGDIIREPTNKLQVCLTFFLVLFLILVQVDVRAGDRRNPAIEVSFPNYTYPKTVTSFVQLDLKNDDVIIFSGKDMGNFHAHLRRGSYEITQHKDTGYSLKLEWIKYVGNDSGDPTYAVAYYVWTMWAASSAEFGVVQLLHIENGRLNVTQQVLFNLRGSKKAGAFLNAKLNSLTIRGANVWEHCCPTALDVVKFRLDEGLLKQVRYSNAPLE